MTLLHIENVEQGESCNAYCSVNGIGFELIDVKTKGRSYVIHEKQSNRGHRELSQLLVKLST